MKTSRRQSGMTLTGMIMVLAVAGFFAYVGMKLFPMYSEYSGVKESMEQVAAMPNSARMGKTQIIDLLYRRFNISYVESVKPEHITIDPKAGPSLRIAYEVRRPLMHNLDVVGKFDYTVKLGATPE